MVDSCEELGKAEALDSHYYQVTQRSERKLEIIIDLVNRLVSLREGSGTKAGGGLQVSTGLVAGLGWLDLELLLVVGFLVVGLACTCGGGAFA